MTLFERICQREGVVFIDMAVDPTQGGRDPQWENKKHLEFYFRNHSACVVPNYIQLGLYDDPELRTAAFFHEMGHIKDRNKYRTKYQQERGAWRVGLRMALRYGFRVTTNILLYRNNCLRGYAKSEWEYKKVAKGIDPDGVILDEVVEKERLLHEEVSQTVV